MPEAVLSAIGRSVSARRPHVDLGAEPESGRTARVVEVEDDALSGSQHPEHRVRDRVGGEVVIGEIGVAHHDADAGLGIVSLDDALHGSEVSDHPDTGRNPGRRQRNVFPEILVF